MPNGESRSSANARTTSRLSAHKFARRTDGVRLAAGRRLGGGRA
jgi:hypothetical protein